VAAGGAEERREALSLAALAASAKGVELSPEALAEFARALRGRDSPERAEPDSCPDSSPESGHESGGNHETEPGPEFGTDKQNPGEDRGAGRGREEARALRKKLLTAQGPLLRLLNGLPGKDGKRWIALPFSTDDGFEGCLRILLRPQAAAYRVERMGLDIRRRGKNTGAGEPAWSFILRADGAETGEPGAANPRETPLLEVFCRPAPGPAGTLERELAALLGLPPDSVRVRDKPFPANTAAFAAVFAEDSRDRIIPSLS
jgi:hypothetical protein